MPTDNRFDSWLSSWPDAVAFGVGLAVAWWAGWNTTDLVWSLWLSSLVVGYCTILWMIGQPAVQLARVTWKGRALAAGTNSQPLTWFWLALAVGVLFLLAFFTIHFGMFHYIHSQFLISFFPIGPGDAAGRVSSAGMSTYVEVMRRYWFFLPSAFLAHRAAFLRKPFSFGPDLSVASLSEANKFGNVMTEPYRNVIRMHMLIFFFAAAHIAKLENFTVYTVVFAVYFFPWRLVRRLPAPVTAVSLQ